MKKYKVQPLDFMQYINTKFHEPFIHELIEFDGDLDLKKLKTAIERLAEAFPLIKCRYDAAGNKFAAIEGVAAENILKTDDSADRQTLLTESLDAGEKSIQFTLCKNSLIVTVSHLICDGSGFKSLMYLLCDFYNGNESADCSRVMNREFSYLTKHLTGTSGMTVRMLFSMLGGYKNQKIYEKAQDESACLSEKTISAATMARVHAKAKERGATLNDVFLTAYARAQSRLYRRKKINIPCTVDLRKYANGNAGIGNLTGTYTLNIKIDGRKSFAKTLTAVSEKMRKQKKTKNDVAGPMLLVSKYEKSTFEQFMKLYGGMNTSPFTDYTNLGVLDDKKLAFNGIAVKNAVGYGGLNKAPYFSVAVSSFRGETTLSSMFTASESERQKAERLLCGIADEMISFAA